MLGEQPNAFGSAQREGACTARSQVSADSLPQRSRVVGQWQGDEYYSRIRKSIQESTRAKSAKVRAVEQRARQGCSKVHTVQIELTTLPNEPIRKCIAKWTQPIPHPASSHTLFREPSAITQHLPERQYRFTTMSFLEPQPIHQRKVVTRPSSQAKMRTVERLSTEVSRKAIAGGATFQQRDKRKSGLFFFEVRSQGIGSREKMVMRLRNIDKGRASRAIHHIL